MSANSISGVIIPVARLVGRLALILGLLAAAGCANLPGGQAVAQQPQAQASDCPPDAVANGGFEQGKTGWWASESWRQHELIGTAADGMLPYRGDYAARLGGFEGVYDVITQTVTVPAQGVLTYWWQMKSYETLPHHDTFAIALHALNGDQLALLAGYDDSAGQLVWKQDVHDLSAYAGQTVVLRFASYNDNWYFTTFHLDEVSLQTGPCSADAQYLPVLESK